MFKAYNFGFLFISLIVFSFNPCAFCQSTMLVLKSESGKTKEINLSKLGNIKVTIPFNSSSIECGSTTYTGKPLSIESGILKMKLKREVFWGRDKGVKIKNEKKADRTKEPEISLNLADAGKLAVNRKTSSNIAGIGRLLVTLGSLTALVTAPLVSIQYAEGGFNSQRYFNVAGVGLGAVVVGIPVILLSRPKTYVMKDFQGNEKELWSIQK